MRFESVYKDWALPLTKFVMKRTGANKKDVDEVVEETFVSAWRGWNAFKHKSSYFTWLCRIALNKISEAITTADNKSLSPEENLALKELRKSVNDCLNLLPIEKRQLLWFRYWKDMTYAEISKMMGVTERAVEGQIYRAKHEFAKIWYNDRDDR
jgi:RNA polymerase sigma factor (sigma-70 family)